MSTAPFLSLTTGGVSSNSALAKKILYYLHGFTTRKKSNNITEKVKLTTNKKQIKPAKCYGTRTRGLVNTYMFSCFF